MDASHLQLKQLSERQVRAVLAATCQRFLGVVRRQGPITATEAASSVLNLLWRAETEHDPGSGLIQSLDEIAHTLPGCDDSLRPEYYVLCTLWVHRCAAEYLRDCQVADAYRALEKARELAELIDTVVLTHGAKHHPEWSKMESLLESEAREQTASIGTLARSDLPIDQGIAAVRQQSTVEAANRRDFFACLFSHVDEERSRRGR